MKEYDDTLTLPSPLPIGWHLYTTVQCPSCWQDLFCIVPNITKGRIIRHMYCSHSDCIQFGNMYEVEYSNVGCRITEVLTSKVTEEK
jgi:hypothetical protein